MHEAEKMFNGAQWNAYNIEIECQISARIRQGTNEVRHSMYVHANAAQRAEAFLRTFEIES